MSLTRERTALLDLLEATGVIVDRSGATLAAYSYDASNYRVPPLVVVYPRDPEQVRGVIAACRSTGTSLVTRGGGTSMAGNAVGAGVVMDVSRYMTRIHRIDTDAMLADVDPGVVLSDLTRAVEDASGGAATFAPDPSSRNRATVGGAIGNDACGNHSVRYGRTTDHVIELDVVTSDGAALTASAGGIRATRADDEYSLRRAEELENGLRDLALGNLAEFRLELGRIPRQVSGYHLAHLLPENGFDAARALVGSEGTCAVVVRARMKLVPRPASALLVCLGYADVVDAARDIPEILTFRPAAVEGIDEDIVETMRMRRGPQSVVGMPAGKAFLYVDLDGKDRASVVAEAERLLSRLQTMGRMREGLLVSDPSDRAALWRVREDGAGLSSRPARGGETMAGWEDSAVAPENLADYLADFRGLLEAHGLTGIMYGHFGAGCMHIRISYDLRTESGREVFRAFTHDAARLVVRHGGSLSGEHGDGRARSELLPVMYSASMMNSFRRFRALWDGLGLLNPGSIVDPAPFDADLALADVPDRAWRTHFDLKPAAGAPDDIDPWVHAVQSCIGVGRCRSDTGGVMCPSFRATHEETDSTRGRSRVLQDMVRGARGAESGWRSEEVRGALDLCLSCKACSTDCPAGVDMSTYKSEFFSHYYAGRIRPMSHYSLGWLPLWLRFTVHISPVVNAVLRTPLRRVLLRAGGLSPLRRLPSFASRRSLRQALGVHGTKRTDGDVVLFVDSFTRGFRPEVAGAAARVVSDAGHTVSCEADACCGLTYISTGQLSTAQRLLRTAIDRLDDGTDRPIVVIEPSCAAALRKDGPELVGTAAAQRVAARIRSFAEAVTDWTTQGWRPAHVASEVTVQTHCHEYAVFGAGVQRAALEAVGVTIVREATGCCGVAGNFGFEAAHYDVSMAVAAQALIPALNRTGPETPVLTDGFSCSMQVQQLEPARRGWHLAEILDPPGYLNETKSVRRRGRRRHEERTSRGAQHPGS
ncbi:FAD-binding oxidoreductase [Microbacterium sp. LWH7-1.2]|uniref:FAD-binding and (Fe-S)-binding domain-containing protein n=1 Tax=Microbacterium sp. LWH7-1.2 TaxID=3135257 RepID=UPI003139D176